MEYKNYTTQSTKTEYASIMLKNKERMNYLPGFQYFHEKVLDAWGQGERIVIRYVTIWFGTYLTLYK
jgi:hypothetical protein